MISPLGYQPSVMPAGKPAAAVAPMFRGEEPKPSDGDRFDKSANTDKAQKPPVNRAERAAGILGGTLMGGAAMGGLIDNPLPPDWPNMILIPAYGLSVLVPGFIGGALGRLGVKKFQQANKQG